MSRSLTIEEDNISVAWAKAFIRVVDVGEISPLTVVIRGFSDGKQMEVARIRQFLDEALGAGKKHLSCNEVANTIFPFSLWNPRESRQKLYARYLRIMPRVLRHPGNRYGVYFQRLIAFGRNAADDVGVNQLEHIIETWHRDNHRRTALQASIFDPFKDHTHQRQRGFPCLQHVAFAKDGSEGLAVTGYYVTQYIFERAYGNYLGLGRLGSFMAKEMDLKLTQVTCVASPAQCDGNKKKSTLQVVAQNIEQILDQQQEGR